MTFEEAKAGLLAEQAWDKERKALPDPRLELMLAIIAEIEAHREFLYRRFGELP